MQSERGLILDDVAFAGASSSARAAMGDPSNVTAVAVVATTLLRKDLREEEDELAISLLVGEADREKSVDAFEDDGIIR